MHLRKMQLYYLMGLSASLSSHLEAREVPQKGQTQCIEAPTQGGVWGGRISSTGNREKGSYMFVVQP
jgi:hypothetical protein